MHLVGYSTPIHCKLSKNKRENLHSIPSMLMLFLILHHIIKKIGDFVFQKNKKINLKKVSMAFIDTKLFKGSLTYGELLIKGKSKKKFLSTYIVTHL